MPKVISSRIVFAASRATVLMSLAVMLGACTYDHLNRSDRITFAGGNAVRANLERETTDPSNASKFALGGLGKNGFVIPEEDGQEASP